MNTNHEKIQKIVSEMNVLRSFMEGQLTLIKDAIRYEDISELNNSFIVLIKHFEDWTKELNNLLNSVSVSEKESIQIQYKNFFSARETMEINKLKVLIQYGDAKLPENIGINDLEKVIDKIAEICNIPY